MRGPRTSRRRQRLGQHFLTDLRVLERQLRYADLEPDDVVLEIGPGLGVLTQRLRERVRRVVAIELDPRMVRELERRGLVDEKVQLLQADAAQMDYAEIGPFDKVVANLPYSASSPITFKLLPLKFRLGVLMYQREFAERMVAPQGSSDYGRLSAACAYFATADILERVPRGAFSPPPQVESALVRLRPHAAPPFAVGSPDSYLELLRIVFSTRRKTLRSTLRAQADQVGLPAATIEGILEAQGIGRRRPEELAPPELGLLDRAVHEARHG